MDTGHVVIHPSQWWIVGNTAQEKIGHCNPPEVDEQPGLYPVALGPHPVLAPTLGHPPRRIPYSLRQNAMLRSLSAVAPDPLDRSGYC